MPEAQIKLNNPPHHETPPRWTWFFGEKTSDCDPERRDILGGKGASLAAMSRAELPVPPGFTISIQACREYHRSGGVWPEGLAEEVAASMSKLEAVMGKRFGEGVSPLLVSVRSGAAVSMPGMMDTILNCGLHRGLADELPSPASFWRVYLQFVRQYISTVARLDVEATNDGDENVSDQAAAQALIRFYEERMSRPFPQTPAEALRDCISAVFDSWNNDRAKIYRKSHDIIGLEGTAVNVQAMFPSDISGIAFTVNPADPSAGQIVIESSYGLGESIVSGEVTPDRFVLDRESLDVTHRVLGEKHAAMASISDSSDAAPRDAHAASLDDSQIQELAQIALNVESFFGYPVDIEWGLSDGRWALLQSRAIRGLDIALDVEVGRKEEIQRLRDRYGQKDKVWVMHNLSETLPTPTPLTWDIIRKFMSGDGGFGMMYREMGYSPNKVVCEEGFLELICGRIYADPDRAAGLFWESMPLEYDHQEILKDPSVLETAPKKFNASRADNNFLLRLPRTIWRMFAAARKTKRLRRDARTRFEECVLPAYRDYLQKCREMDLAEMSTADVISELKHRERHVLDEFGKESLKPGFFGAIALGELQAYLTELMGEEQGGDWARRLTSGLDGDSTVEQNIMLEEVANGRATLAAFVKEYGHRAVCEMELSLPRWREDAAYLEKMIQRDRAVGVPDPQTLHHRNQQSRLEAEEQLPEMLKTWGGSFLREKINSLLAEAQQLLPYREVGKHYLMMGYEQIRSAIMELSRRWGLGRDVFFLRLKELGDFENQRDEMLAVIARRKIRWQSAQRLDMPVIIHSSDMDTLGLLRDIQAEAEMDATPLSSGVATGLACRVFSPEEAADLPDGCILVCPSTDPSWTALFPSISAIVVERGGVLSHGAITARDFGIPAVACEDATRKIPDRVKIRVDGDHGHIAILGEVAS